MRTRLALAAGLMTLAAGAAHATTVREGTGFLETYAGPRPAADLDAVSASATFDGQNLFLSATMAGRIGTTAEGSYVWGVNRGSGTDLLFHPSKITDTRVPVGKDVPFDAFIFMDNDGGGFVALLEPGDNPGLLQDPTPLPAGSVTISGRTISLVIPRSMLPEQGAHFEDFGYNIWPRFGGTDSNTRVSDFLPDASSFLASAAPEPSSWALMILGFGLAGSAMRRRRMTAA